MERIAAMGYTPDVDAKGSVLVHLEGQNSSGPRVLVTAHMDEIALMITKIEDDGKIRVAAYGGVYAWKWGEGPVEIMTLNGLLPGVLSFGCIHTNDEKSVAEYMPVTIRSAWIARMCLQGLTRAELDAQGVRAGPARHHFARSRRAVEPRSGRMCRAISWTTAPTLPPCFSRWKPCSNREPQTRRIMEA